MPPLSPQCRASATGSRGLCICYVIGSTSAITFDRAVSPCPRRRVAGMKSECTAGAIRDCRPAPAARVIRGRSNTRRGCVRPGESLPLVLAAILLCWQMRPPIVARPGRENDGAVQKDDAFVESRRSGGSAGHRVGRVGGSATPAGSSRRARAGAVRRRRTAGPWRRRVGGRRGRSAAATASGVRGPSSTLSVCLLRPATAATGLLPAVLLLPWLLTSSCRRSGADVAPPPCRHRRAPRCRMLIDSVVM